MKTWFLYQKVTIEFRLAILFGKIGEWFLWQEWKQFADREEFDSAIKRLREFHHE